MSDSGHGKSRRNKKRGNRRKNKNKETAKQDEQKEGSVDLDCRETQTELDAEKTSLIQSPESELERRAADEENSQNNGLTSEADGGEKQSDNQNVTSVKPECLQTDPNVGIENIQINLNNCSSYETVTDIKKTRIEKYVVESPKQTLKFKDKKKLINSNKSKSLDNTDDNCLQIVEVTELDLRSDDEKLAETNVIVLEAESDMEWEGMRDQGKISENAPDLVQENIAASHRDQPTPMSAQDELNLRNFLNTLNLATSPTEVTPPALGIPEINIKLSEDHPTETENDIKLRRARKKAALEEHFLPQLANPRFLDVIDEEGSNESSDATRRQSFLSDLGDSQKCSDFDDGIVVLDKNIKDPLRFFPKPKKYFDCKSELKRQQECLLVGTKILEADVEEGCGDWKIEKTEMQRGADIVYLDDSSESTSEVDMGDDNGESDFADDERVTIKTPTIEFNSNFQSIGNMSSPFNILRNTHDIPNNIIKVQEFTDDIIPLPVKLNKYVFTPPPSPETVSNVEETLEGLERLSVYAPSPVACNEVIMLANEFVDELPIITETLKSHSNLVKSDESDVKVRSHETVACNGESATNSLLSNSEGEEMSNSSSKENLTQDSSSSYCSSHSTSHSTAKYNPTSSSLTDIVALVHDDFATFSVLSVDKKNDENTAPDYQGKKCDINVFKNITDNEDSKDYEDLYYIDRSSKSPNTLREMCVSKVASFPYGKAMLEELASVSESLEILTNKLRPAGGNSDDTKSSMPVCREPDLSPAKQRVAMQRSETPGALQAGGARPPPPLAPRQSSFRATSEPTWSGLPCRAEPQILAYLSPAQRTHMETTNSTDRDEAAELIDMHCKYAERRGYHETLVDLEKPLPANNIGENMVAGQEAEKRERGAPPAPPRAAPPRAANRLLAIVRDPAVNPDASVDMTEQPSSTFHFADTLRTFENLNNDSSSNVKQTSWVKKSGNDPAEGLDISERLTTNKAQIKASLKKGIPDDTDFSLKAIKESNQSQVAIPLPYINGTDSQKKVKHVIKISKPHHHSTDGLDVSRKEEATSHVQRLQNKRAFLLDDPIFDEPAKNEKNKSQADVEENGGSKRRSSLPKDLHERQMEYILRKEKEIQEQIKWLEEQKRLSFYENPRSSGPKAPMLPEENVEQSFVSNKRYAISRQRDIATIQTEEKRESQSSRDKADRSSISSLCSEAEKFRDQMYNEYMDKVAEREERKQHKVIKITNVPVTTGSEENLSKANSTSRDSMNEIRNSCGLIEEEFISMAKKRWDKLGFKDPETEDEGEKENGDSNVNGSVDDGKVVEHKIKVLDGDEEKDVKKLPSHLQEFVKFTSSGEGDEGDSLH